MHKYIKQALNVLIDIRRGDKPYYQLSNAAFLPHSGHPFLAIFFHSITIYPKPGKMGIHLDKLNGIESLIVYLRLYFPHAFKIWASGQQKLI
jgi:hypothetical protein